MKTPDQNPQVVFMIEAVVKLLMQEGRTRHEAILDAMLYLRRLKNTAAN